MPKPASDLEQFLAGDFDEKHDAVAVTILLIVVLLLAVATLTPA